jgi:hypothetical protein
MFWLRPNALFETARPSGESSYRDEAGFTARLAKMGFDVVAARATTARAGSRAPA